MKSKVPKSNIGFSLKTIFSIKKTFCVYFTQIIMPKSSKKSFLRFYFFRVLQNLKWFSSLYFFHQIWMWQEYWSFKLFVLLYTWKTIQKEQFVENFMLKWSISFRISFKNVIQLTANWSTGNILISNKCVCVCVCVLFSVSLSLSLCLCVAICVHACVYFVYILYYDTIGG